MSTEAHTICNLHRGDATPASTSTLEGVASPAPYAGKFDPKAIAKMAVARTSNTAFSSSPTVSALPKARANLSGFGLSVKSGQESDKPSSKRNLDFG
ncbi:hypothetical protein GLAREA_06701 [Glarea lozoyensis ATCC 20868]|uniref:Uncharacterized protein n=1 Tax=Glarea lozoyensis (strain ATCC 20868 / MF5171) TaxID=1116229 RepID=S3E5N6_GLAL2|nr:uncharacterized protein GLAREA_06701 [Glarea lozoyensis ATCC 20868]EPE33688.1 hypothetical protein GLAREA_06701 [Glarea lozoyensis ATCC 20868]